jgi:UPF0716 protein FxsA
VLVWLFILFTVLPVVELWVLITIGRSVGAIPTVLMVVGMGVLGAALAKREGSRVFRGWRAAIAEGRVPEEGILEGALVLVGGVLLLTPGVVTDVMGMACLFRPTRRIIAGIVRKKLEAKIADGSIRMQGFSFGGGARGSRGDATGRVVSSEDVPEKSGGDDEAPPSTLLH